jgi:DNA-binding XRE family transcriptional regulator
MARVAAKASAVATRSEIEEIYSTPLRIERTRRLLSRRLFLPVKKRSILRLQKLPRRHHLRVTRLPNQQFGRNICRLRTALGLTQEKLAENADISRRYVQQIEAGEMNPTINVAARLRTALKCTWNDLFAKI